MKTVELYARVRHAVLIEGISERAAADRFGINARTVSKMLKFSVPPGYVRRKPFRPNLDEFTGVIDAILAADRERPKKQRYTSKRIFERLAPRWPTYTAATIFKGIGFAHLTSDEARRIANGVARLPDFMMQRKGFCSRGGGEHRWKRSRLYPLSCRA
jgi:hypothetical protein